jgi:hypothetical protein
MLQYLENCSILKCALNTVMSKVIRLGGWAAVRMFWPRTTHGPKHKESRHCHVGPVQNIKDFHTKFVAMTT